jgi:hypothetical protein
MYPSAMNARRPAEQGDAAIDLTLIDAMLALTPEERLRQNDRMVRTIEELRDAFDASRADHPAGHPGR